MITRANIVDELEASGVQVRQQYTYKGFKVETPEAIQVDSILGVITAHPGDWILQDSNTENLVVVSEVDFRKVYESADETEVLPGVEKEKE